MVRFYLVAVVLALAVACGSEPDAATPQEPVSTSTPKLQVPTIVASTATPASPDQPTSLVTLSDPELRGLTHPGLRAAVDDLWQRASGDLDQVGIVRAESATWRNAGLGCPDLGEMYAQALTAGIWLVLSYGGSEYDYRIVGSRATLCTQSDQEEPLERRPLPGLWTTLAQMPTPRSEVAAVALEGKVYVFGGFGAGSTANEVYDPATDTWLRLAPIPTPVNHTGAVALDGNIYLIGGFDPGFGPVGTVWAYDPGDDSWTAKADLPLIRGALAVATMNGKIYAIGGRGDTGDLGTTELYDPATDTWTSRSPMPTARDHVAVSVVVGEIFIVGGRLGTFARNLGANESYNPRADAWKRRSPLPTVRSGIAGAAIGGSIYVFGGENVEGTFDENERYSPLTDTWEALPPMPTARHGLGAAVVGNRVYVLAGGTTPGGSQSNLNEAFIVLPGDEGGTVSSVDDGPPVPAASDGILAPDETTLLRSGLIAYADPQGRIRTIRPDGSSPVTINPVEAFSGWPSWSPDGSQVAFSGILSNEDGQVDFALYVRGLEDEAAEQVFLNEPGIGPILPNMPHCPLWAPDGSGLLIMAGDPEGLTLFLAHPGEGAEVDVVLRNSPLYASWSADSRRVLVHGGPDHFLVDINGSVEVTNLSHRASGYRVPAFWPSGGKLTLVSNGVLGRALSIANTELSDVFRLVGAPGEVAYLSAPDGSLLAVAQSDIPGGFLYQGVSLYNPDGSLYPVTINEVVVAFFWSPDSTKLAYVTFTDTRGDRRWNVLDVRDGTRWPLVEFTPSGPQYTLFQFFDQFAYSHSMWSPDGGSLVFSGNLSETAIDASFRRQPVPRIIVTETVPDPLVFSITDGFIAVWSPK